MNKIIARYTTPAITYKPSAVEVGSVDEIYLVIKQNEIEIIRKGKADAVTDENGFTWFLEQTDTAKLNSWAPSVVQIDYTAGAARYTTCPRFYTITESAINEVI